MSIIYAVVRTTDGHRSVVMVSRERGLADSTALDLTAGLRQQFDVVPVTMPGMAFLWGYRKMFERTCEEMRRTGFIS